MVVNHHVGNGSYAVRPERIDERAQLFSRTEARILVKKVVGIVAHGEASVGFAALWQPYKGEVAVEIGCLLLQFHPACVLEAVPVKALKHDPIVA